MSETVTVSATEYQAARKLNDLLNKIWMDPEVGGQVRQRVKALDPTIPIPDDHPVAVEVKGKLTATEAALEKLSGEFAEYRTANETARQEADLRRQLGDVQTRRGLTDEGMAGTIAIMQERQIADPDAAALLYLDSLPKAKPTPASSRVFDTKLDLFGTTKIDEQWRKLHEDEPGFFADVVNDVFSEMPAA